VWWRRALSEAMIVPIAYSNLMCGDRSGVPREQLV
jgi:hypothetical protein